MRGAGFWDRVTGVCITPFKAPTMPLIASWLPGKAPINPPTAVAAGIEVATGCMPPASAPTVMPLICWTPGTAGTCCAGLWPAGGGVERAEELLVLWPLEVKSCWEKRHCSHTSQTTQCARRWVTDKAYRTTALRNLPGLIQEESYRVKSCFLYEGSYCCSRNQQLELE